MPDKKISELASSGSLTGAEELPIVQSATTFKTLLSSIKTFILGGLKTSDLINDGDDGNPFISLNDLPSNLTLYATNAASDISGYFKLVSSITDPSYNTVAVDIPTGAITTANQFIASLATSPNVIVGNPGIFNITTIGNIQKLSGTGNAEFYFEVWKRVAAGTETLITISGSTLPVLNSGYAEFSASALWNDGVFLATDRIVLKYYATRIPTGSDPSYQFQFGGLSPVRSLVPIPLNVTTNISGTTNYVSKFTTAGAIGNSQIFDDGTNVGINTVLPTAKFHSKGIDATSSNFALKVENSASSSLFSVRNDRVVSIGSHTPASSALFVKAASTTYVMYLQRRLSTVMLLSIDDTNDDVNFKSENSDFIFSNIGGGAGEAMRIKNTGNVGIGTASPTSKLHIRGVDFSTNFGLKVDNSLSENLFSIRNDGVIIANNLPTSAAGLPAGAIWRNGNVLNIV